MHWSIYRSTTLTWRRPKVEDAPGCPRAQIPMPHSERKGPHAQCQAGLELLNSTSERSGAPHVNGAVGHEDMELPSRGRSQDSLPEVLHLPPAHFAALVLDEDKLPLHDGRDVRVQDTETRELHPRRGPFHGLNPGPWAFGWATRSPTVSWRVCWALTGSRWPAPCPLVSAERMRRGAVRVFSPSLHGP